MAPLFAISDLPDVLQGIGAFLVTVTTTIVVPVAAAAWKEWRRRKKAVDSVPPMQHLPSPPPPAPFGVSPDSTLQLRLHALERWQMDERIKEAEELRQHLAEVSADARRTADALLRAQTRADAALAKVATLEAVLEQCRAEVDRTERERIAADNRAQKATEELRRCKQEANAGLSTQPATITPMRPPNRSKP